MTVGTYENATDFLKISLYWFSGNNHEKKLTNKEGIFIFYRLYEKFKLLKNVFSDDVLPADCSPPGVPAMD